MTGGSISQQFCVRWNSHLGSLGAAFPQLLAGQRFVDVTLACEGHQVHCHRLVLAACSSYFESLLGENPCKHPIIILPRDIKLWEIQALVDFMYKGEVNVSQAGLPDLLRCAEILQIRGLCGSDAALNLNQVSTNSSSGTTTPLTTAAQLGNEGSKTGGMTTSTPNKSGHPSPGTSSNMPNLLQSKTGNSTTTKSSSSLSSLQAQEKTNSSNSMKKENIICQPSVIIPEVNLEECDDSQNGSNSEMMDDGELKIQEDFSDDNSIVKMEPEIMSDTYQDYSNDRQNISNHHQNHNDNNHYYPPHPYDDDSEKSFGKIRVKSNENLFENYTTKSSKARHHPISSSSLHSTNDDVDALATIDSINQLLPPSLKFNENSMAIFVTKQSEQQQQMANNSDNDNNTLVNSNLESDNNLQTSAEAAVSGYENIICSPNFVDLSYDEQDDAMAPVEFSDGMIDFESLGQQQGGYGGGMLNFRNHLGGKLLGSHFMPKLLPYGGGGNHGLGGGITVSGMKKEKDIAAAKKRKYLANEELRKREKQNFENWLNNGGPPPNTFVLRNPRGNQPRTYNTDALWAALVDVKAGESIYRASQVHKVPRKTLRNWMKRWDIKSAYPMPRQLQQAAQQRKANETVNQIFKPNPNPFSPKGEIIVDQPQQNECFGREQQQTESFVEQQISLPNISLLNQ